MSRNEALLPKLGLSEAHAPEVQLVHLAAQQTVLDHVRRTASLKEQLVEQLAEVEALRRRLHEVNMTLESEQRDASWRESLLSDRLRDAAAANQSLQWQIEQLQESLKLEKMGTQLQRKARAQIQDIYSAMLEQQLAHAAEAREQLCRELDKVKRQLEQQDDRIREHFEKLVDAVTRIALDSSPDRRVGVWTPRLGFEAVPDGDVEG
jgi:hypothetical protein